MFVQVKAKMRSGETGNIDYRLLMVDYWGARPLPTMAPGHGLTTSGPREPLDCRRFTLGVPHLARCTNKPN